MPTQGSPSTLANIMAMRSRLAGARTRMGLENQNMIPSHGGVIAPVMPSQPSQPPAAVVSPAAQAAMGPPLSPNPAMQNEPTPPGQPGPTGFHPVDSSQAVAPPPGQMMPLTSDQNEHQNMLAMVQQFISKNGPQQQAMMDKQKMQQQQPANGPLGDFQQRTGRTPDPQELLIIAATARLTKELGRQPTMQEVQQFLGQDTEQGPPGAMPPDQQSAPMPPPAPPAPPDQSAPPMAPTP